MVQQMVMRLGTTDPVIALEDNPLDKSPIDFQDLEKGRRVPRLGSQDILRIAEYALSIGWRVERFQIADRTLTPVQGREESKASKALLRWLAEAGAAAAATYFTTEWPSYFVTGVQIAAPDHRILQLRRQGVVWVPESWETEAFLSGAWRAVHFS
ncbi:hypothetical protein [Leifsonia aquatica]|uniref:hypothetical protein n=1 Tax=Leifsonia aquatica TaxID=144185 RepID=UPI00381B6428